MLSGNNMKIEQFGTLLLQRSNEGHFGNAKINNSYENQFAAKKTEGSFQSFLMDAMNTVNTQQTNVSKIQEKLITDPDSFVGVDFINWESVDKKLDEKRKKDISIFLESLNNV